MRRLLRLTIYVLVVGVGTLAPHSSFAADPAPAMVAADTTVRVSSSTGIVGAEVRIPIVVDQATDLGAIELTLAYDPALLEFVRLDPGQHNTGLVESNLVQPGLLKIGCIAEPALAGDIELFVLSMKVVAAGSANLTLDRVKLNAGSTGAEIPAIAQAGVLTASDAGGTPPPPPVVPPPGPIPRADGVRAGSWVLLGLLLAGSLALAIGVAVLLRRRKTGG